MKKILNDSQKIHDSIGFQHFSNKNGYKPFPYCVIIDVDNGKLIYNTMTRGMIFLESQEYAQYINCQPQDSIAESLIKRWYMIPQNVDASSMCYMFRQTLNESANHKLEKLTGYTILTTTNCNARCPYCYEKEYCRRDMSKKTAIDVAKYIFQTSDKSAILHWFGGEPLCNAEAINIICQRLNDYGVKYNSSMITNGYLLDKSDIDIIKGLWKLKQVQITLDGTEIIYNAIKRFVYDDPNPFEKVINNIRLMVDNKIEVIIRLNVSEDNIENLIDLGNYLSEKFGGIDLFSVYVSPLFNEDSIELYSGCSKIWNHICNLGIGHPKIAPVKKMCCMADSRHSVVITPEGNLGLCEHYADEEYIGSIYSKQLNIPMIESWAERNENTQCIECLLYPQCIQLKKCPSAFCNERKQKYQVNKVKEFMIQIYKARVKNL